MYLLQQSSVECAIQIDFLCSFFIKMVLFKAEISLLELFFFSDEKNSLFWEKCLC